MKLDALECRTFTLPTPTPEQDGTADWSATTAVVVTVGANGREGLGWTYSTPAAATLVEGVLREVVMSVDAAEISEAFVAMRRACRNFGLAGLVMQAISAVDVALWDLAGHVAEEPVHALLGLAGEPLQLYGSGGFTNQTDLQLAAQVRSWQESGVDAMKIKIGRDEERDRERLALLRELAPDVAVMVDANGAYTRDTAQQIGKELDELGVVWFEEPVTSDDAPGLAQVRHGTRCDVTAGEYASDHYDADRLAPVVDCLQLDVTRCGGYTGYLQCAEVAEAHGVDISTHCAPALHAPLGGLPGLRHGEYFSDHARLEPMLFRNVPAVRDGLMVQNQAPGHGMQLVDNTAGHHAAR